MRLTKENPHVKLSTMNTMTKEDLLAAIHSPDVLLAGMALRKDTLIDILNFQLNHDPDAEVKP